MPQLKLPATPSAFLAEAVSPALKMLPEKMDSPEARVLLAAIALQESGLKHRYQVVQGQPGVKGPARGLLQFERGGGCTGVLRHHRSDIWMREVCERRACLPTPSALWLAIEHDDVLAAAAGRLLIFTDPPRLPALGDAEAAWLLYERVWRPGKPHPSTWPDNYRRALEAVTAWRRIPTRPPATVMQRRRGEPDWQDTVPQFPRELENRTRDDAQDQQVQRVRPEPEGKPDEVA